MTGVGPGLPPRRLPALLLGDQSRLQASSAPRGLPAGPTQPRATRPLSPPPSLSTEPPCHQARASCVPSSSTPGASLPPSPHPLRAGPGCRPGTSAAPLCPSWAGPATAQTQSLCPPSKPSAHPHGLRPSGRRPFQGCSHALGVTWSFWWNSLSFLPKSYPFPCLLPAALHGTGVSPGGGTSWLQRGPRPLRGTGPALVLYFPRPRGRPCAPTLPAISRAPVPMPMTGGSLWAPARHCGHRAQWCCQDQRPL